MNDQTLTPEENALEGARAYFGPGRCSGHAQFNGRHCRVSAGPEQWCIHCAGNMLVAALTAAHERETALREENERLVQVCRDWSDTTDANVTALAEAQREIEKWKVIASENGSSGLIATNLLAAERQKVTALVEKLLEMRKYTAKAIEHRHGYPKGDAFGDGLVQGHMNHLSALDALGLTTAQPTTGEPGT